MANLQDIIKLCEADQGKVFIMDEQGDVKLVILGVEHYQDLMLGSLKQKVASVVADLETANSEILQAQLEEDEGFRSFAEAASGRFGELKRRNMSPDLRQEVIDPTFGNPQHDNDNEIIRPDFDDI